MLEQSLNTIPTDILQQLTAQQAWHYQVVPISLVDNVLKVLINDNQNQSHVQEELEIILGKEIIFRPTDTLTFRKLLTKHYRRDNPDQQRTQTLNQSGDLLVNLIEEARQLGSSDIHLEPYEKRCRVRIRIDGLLVERYILEKSEYPGIVNKIKIRSNLDIAEKRLPQDGRIFFENNAGKKFDIRVSTLPTLHGEKVVMRLLSQDATSLDVHNLGFSPETLNDYLEGVRLPNGIILISGPTGSGKTTTLYATMNMLNKSSRNIVTIEDPIEYTLEGINQVQLRENIGLDFAETTKTFLRQDPNIIMVGEIRDKETASAAIRASLAGHLVFSTIHTNSAWGIVARLTDMGVPSYLLADTLNTAVAQRLLRKLCQHCKTAVKLESSELPKRFKAPRKLDQQWKAEGCEHCFHTGYKGRQAIYEVIPIDRELSWKIKQEEFQVDDLLKEKGIQKLSDQAFRLLENGEASLEEVYPILAAN